MLLSLALGLLLPLHATLASSGEGTRVQIPAPGGGQLAGTLWLPSGDASDAALLVVSTGDEAASSWRRVRDPLLADGWSVLAVNTDDEGHLTADAVRRAAEFLASSGKGRSPAIVGMASGGAAHLLRAAVESDTLVGGCAFGAKVSKVELPEEASEDPAGILYVAGERAHGGTDAEDALRLTARTAEPSRAVIVERAKSSSLELLNAKKGPARAVLAFLRGVALGREPVERELTASDDLPVTADAYWPHPEGSPVLVLCHQAGTSRGEYRDLAPVYTTLGFNVLALDQRSGNAVLGVSNKTAAEASKRGLEQGFLDALPDLLAGLEHARASCKDGPVILAGSSYSASLALVVASEYPKLVTAAMSFSPGEYLAKRGFTFVRECAASIKCPTFITSARAEAPAWQSIFDAIPGKVGKDKWSFVPETAGNHGAATLWPRTPGSRAHWTPVEEFVLAIAEQH